MVDKNYVLEKNREFLSKRREDLEHSDSKYIADDLKTIEKLMNRIDTLEGQDLTDVVLIGSTFSVSTNFTGQVEVDTYTLGMSLDLDLGTISALSKLGAAVFGHKVGEVVQYYTDNRDLEAHIVNEALDFVVDEKENSYTKHLVANN